MDDHHAPRWEELSARAESSTRSAVLRRPSMVPEVAARPPPPRGILRRMSHGFAAAGAVSLGVQEWPTDWKTEWRRPSASAASGAGFSPTFSPSSVGSTTSLSSLSSSPTDTAAPLSSSAPAASTLKDARWRPPPTLAARKDSLHTQEQECVMDMVCLI